MEKIKATIKVSEDNDKKVVRIEKTNNHPVSFSMDKKMAMAIYMSLSKFSKTYFGNDVIEFTSNDKTTIGAFEEAEAVIESINRKLDDVCLELEAPDEIKKIAEELVDGIVKIDYDKILVEYNVKKTKDEAFKNKYEVQLQCNMVAELFRTCYMEFNRALSEIAEYAKSDRLNTMALFKIEQKYRTVEKVSYNPNTGMISICPFFGKMCYSFAVNMNKLVELSR